MARNGQFYAEVLLNPKSINQSIKS